jgi:DNA polymerase III subunit delta'
MIGNDDIPEGPRYTSALIGHEAAERTFLEAYQQDRLHHAWLLSGPKGIGKATLAWKFAKFLLTQPTDNGPGLFGGALPVEKPTTLSVDADNPDIQRIESGGHGGLRLVERTENEKTGKLRNDIVIGDIRKVISFFAQTSAEGGWRVAIIDAADEMNANAANALLKILEEPPEKSILFLVAHAPGKLLPTIKSRCRALKLQTLAEDCVQAVLAARHPALGPEELIALSRLSDGAPGRAIELFAQDGVALYQQMGGLISGLPRLNVPAVHKLAVQLGAIKADAQYRLFIQLFLGWLERLIRQNASNIAAADVMEGESAQIARISALAGVDRWLDLWEKMGRLIVRADAVNLDRKQVIVSLFTSLAATARGQ